MYMRLIRPIFTEEGCMQCHATQVYIIGEIRGGMSVTIPMEHYKEELINKADNALYQAKQKGRNRVEINN